MLLKNKKIAIIGAGPVGLTMAKLLQQNGGDVTVYERDKDASARISGGTLDLHKTTGQKVMQKAGLLESYYDMAKPMGRTVADKNGNVLFSKKPIAENQYDNPEINRNDLRRLLLSSLEEETVVWDRKFTGLIKDNEKWLLQFENKIEVSADFVIGANGGMSVARKYITDAKIEYTGTLIIQGEVSFPKVECPDFNQLCNGTILMTAEDGNLLVANPKNGAILSYSVFFNKPEEFAEIQLNFQDKENIISFLTNRFGDWHESYQQLFRSTSSFVLWPTRKIGLDKSWKKNRPLPITLIGDAAHIMPPFAGQGLNIGLVDALILSDNLTNGTFETIEDAIYDYEKQMMIYAKEAQFETAKNEATMIHPTFSFLKNYE